MSVWLSRSVSMVNQEHFCYNRRLGFVRSVSRSMLSLLFIDNVSPFKADTDSIFWWRACCAIVWFVIRSSVVHGKKMSINKIGSDCVNEWIDVRLSQTLGVLTTRNIPVF